MQYLALVQPADGLQAHVGVRRHLHAGVVGDVVGAVVIDEAPGTDHAAAQVGQQAADLGGLAELDVTRAEEFPDGLGHHEATAAAQGGNRLAIKIAHGAQPSSARADASGQRALVY
ncbi:thiamine biosynthesis protein ThiC [Streptomyces sp. V4I2]|nr:thiamine biosynthesis protein ThiC [Streptomyces sp. V4I2]